MLEFSNYKYDYELNVDRDYKLQWIDDHTFEYIKMYDFCTLFNKNIYDLSMEELKQLPKEEDEYNKIVKSLPLYKVVINNQDGQMHYIFVELLHEHNNMLKEYKDMLKEYKDE